MMQFWWQTRQGKVLQAKIENWLWNNPQSHSRPTSQGHDGLVRGKGKKNNKLWARQHQMIWKRTLLGVFQFSSCFFCCDRAWRDPWSPHSDIARRLLAFWRISSPMFQTSNRVVRIILHLVKHGFQTRVSLILYHLIPLFYPQGTP